MKKTLCLIILTLTLTLAGCSNKNISEPQTTNDGVVKLEPHTNVVSVDDTVEVQEESEELNDVAEVINSELYNNCNAIDKYITDYQTFDMKTEVYAVYNYTDWDDFWDEPDLDPLKAQLEECGVNTMVSRHGSFDEDNKTVEIVIYDFPEDMISVFKTKYDNVLEIKDIKYVWDVYFWSDTKIPDFMLDFLQEDKTMNELNVEYRAYDNHEEQRYILPAAYCYIFYFYKEPTDELISNVADALFNEYDSLACNTTDYVYYYHKNNMDSIARMIDNKCDCDITYADFSKVMKANSKDIEIIDELLSTISWTLFSTVEGESGKHNAGDEVIKFYTLEDMPEDLY